MSDGFRFTQPPAYRPVGSPMRHLALSAAVLRPRALRALTADLAFVALSANRHHILHLDLDAYVLLFAVLADQLEGNGGEIAVRCRHVMPLLCCPAPCHAMPCDVM